MFEKRIDAILKTNNLLDALYAVTYNTWHTRAIGHNAKC